MNYNLQVFGLQCSSTSVIFPDKFHWLDVSVKVTALFPSGLGSLIKQVGVRFVFMHPWNTISPRFLDYTSLSNASNFFGEILA